jgi:hypothetical protein
MRYSVFIKENENIDTIVLRIEMANEDNEVIKVNRLMDYLIVKSEDPSSLNVMGVVEVSEDSDFSGLHQVATEDF